MEQPIPQRATSYSFILLKKFRRMKGIPIASQDFKLVCNVKMIILRCIDKQSGPAAAQELRISF